MGAEREGQGLNTSAAGKLWRPAVQQKSVQRVDLMYCGPTTITQQQESPPPVLEMLILGVTDSMSVGD